MTLKLSSFLASNSQFSEESGKRLLLYVSFVQCFCQQYHVSYQQDGKLEGLLPFLFRQVSEYTVEKAAIIFDSAMPWELLQSNSQLALALSHFHHISFFSIFSSPSNEKFKKKAAGGGWPGRSARLTPRAIGTSRNLRRIGYRSDHGQSDVS